MRDWQVREDYRSLLKKTKKLFPSVLAHVKLNRIFLCSTDAAKSAYLARIHPNRRPWSLVASEYDYTIETWATKFDSLSEAWKVFVMLHELWHIPQEGFDTESKAYRRTVKHDIEDFTVLRKVYGLGHENVEAVLKGERYLLGIPMKFPRGASVK